MEYLAACCSLRGGRPYNEDTVFTSGCPGGGFLALVADGLGGQGAGDVASGEAVRAFAAGFQAQPGLAEVQVSKLFAAANGAVRARQSGACKMMSTLAALLCCEGRAVAAHVGDTRVYRFTGGRLRFQSKDHSVSQMAVYSGEITQRGVRFHADRNKVLRALGAGEAVKPDIHPFAGSLSGDDAFLLCTDGFWEYVLEAEMEADLIKSETPQMWLSYLLGRLAKRVAAKGGDNDNLSAAAVFCREERT